MCSTILVNVAALWFMDIGSFLKIPSALVLLISNDFKMWAELLKRTNQTKLDTRPS